MTINNKSKIQEEHIEDLRGAYQHRATWLYLLVDEARKKGLDPNEFARAAIKRCGVIHGKSKFSDQAKEELAKLAEEFVSPPSSKIFEMELAEQDEQKLVIEFNYCPLVAAWQKLGLEEEEIDHLCDIAMDGDRGIFSTFADFELDIQERIAAGGDVCRLVINNKKQ